MKTIEDHLIKEKCGLVILNVMQGLALKAMPTDRDVLAERVLQWPGAGMFTLFFALGAVDGIAEGPSRVIAFFSERTLAMFVALFIYKFLVHGVGDVLGLIGNSVLPEAYRFVQPHGIMWFFEVTILLRMLIRVFQAIRFPRWLQCLIVFGTSCRFVTSNEEMFSFPFQTNFVVRMFFGSHWYIGVCGWAQMCDRLTQLDCDSGTTPAGLGLCFFDNPVEEIWSAEYDWYACAHIYAYYWGESSFNYFRQLCRRGSLFFHGDRVETNANPHWAALASFCCYVSAVLLQIGVQMATHNEKPQAKMLKLPLPWLYMVLEWLQLLTTCTLVVIASILLPWHAKRIGGNALGIYIFHLTFPLVSSQWTYPLISQLADMGNGYM